MEDSATANYAQHLTASNLQDCKALFESLKTCVEYIPVAARRSAFAKVQTILKRGLAFALLRSPTELHLLSPSDRSVYGPLVIGVMESLGAYTLWYEATTRPEYASLAKDPPVTLEQLFNWIDFVHPKNDWLVPTSKDMNVLERLSTLFATILRRRTKNFAQYVRNEPYSLRLIIDLWLNFHLYITPEMEGATERAPVLIMSTLSLFEDLADVDGGQETFIAQLLALVRGSRRRVLRCHAAHTAFLERLDFIEGWRWIWKTHFGIASVLTQSEVFHDVVAPRCFIRSLISGTRHCLKTPDYEGMNHVADAVMETIEALISKTSHVTNLRLAIKAGLFPLLVDLERQWGGEKAVLTETLRDDVADSLTIASVLRAFHRRHSDLLRPTSDSFVEKHFVGILRAYRMLWPQYSITRDPQHQQQSIPCSNLTLDEHTAEIRACPCGVDFSWLEDTWSHALSRSSSLFRQAPRSSAPPVSFLDLLPSPRPRRRPSHTAAIRRVAFGCVPPQSAHSVIMPCSIHFSPWFPTP
ncbi:hypothetical protein BD626DRAFT_412239 [Schizophyllum amplum]|uniref:Uncharacterized protein n=1 Tax=Schizophyllum amplum TaxID=97359 RepID=A0A550BXM4_9AGAR|nr:hypothetical protein BD626DRAFT_412239 [Auriculariopsis ampla]